MSYRHLFLALFLMSFLISTAAKAEDQRTFNMFPDGHIFYPAWLFNKPDHYEFSPAVSNWDPQHQHPRAWDGQDWSPSMWNAAWTPEKTITHFFQLRVFEKQYIDESIPVLEVGPMFYQLSDLDQRRSLKLLTDTTGIFTKGYSMVMLRDWKTGRIVGNQTPKGMHLN